MFRVTSSSFWCSILISVRPLHDKSHSVASIWVDNYIFVLTSWWTGVQSKYVLCNSCSASLCCCRVSALVPSLTQQPSRRLTYYSVKKGKRKSVKSVTDRFMRLHCGLWIRRKVCMCYSCLNHMLIVGNVLNKTSWFWIWTGWIQEEALEEETCQTKAPQRDRIL